MGVERECVLWRVHDGRVAVMASHSVTAASLPSWWSHGTSQSAHSAATNMDTHHCRHCRPVRRVQSVKLEGGCALWSVRQAAAAVMASRSATTTSSPTSQVRQASPCAHSTANMDMRITTSTADATDVFSEA